MDAWIREIVIFVFGVVGSFVASAVYDWYKDNRIALRAQEDEWKLRLSSEDLAIRSRAFQDVLIRIFRWSLLGNVMFGISGLVGILDLFQVYALSNAVAAASSLLAVIMFGFALSWVKRYRRASRLFQEATVKIETKPSS